MIFDKKNQFSFVGYLLDYPLSPYLGNSPAAAFAIFGHSSIATISTIGGDLI